MNRWVSYLLLVSFVRLQFVCCCGSVALISVDCNKSACHLNCTEIRVEPVSARKDICSCDHHEVRVQIDKCSSEPGKIGESLNSIGICDFCCMSCEHEEHHRHHLCSLHDAKLPPNSKIGLSSVILTHTFIVVSVIEDGTLGKADFEREQHPRNSTGILSLLGQLRI